jgi:predicted RNA-binding protein YlqC (UPF0109 family)
MKNLLIQIARSLVDDPEQVQVNEILSAQTVVLELRVAKSDMGKIIGKQGRTANAIRSILSAASGKTRKKCVLEIVE